MIDRMNDEYILSEISESIISAPDSLLKKIKYEIAKGIANDLLMKLNKQIEPRKQESIDKVYIMIKENSPKQYLKGA
jgi:hypothetical protein